MNFRGVIQFELMISLIMHMNTIKHSSNSTLLLLIAFLCNKGLNNQYNVTINNNLAKELFETSKKSLQMKTSRLNHLNNEQRG